MRWRPRNPGDTRTVQRFAWLPVKLSDDEAVWLEPYWTEEEWEDRVYGGERWYVRRHHPGRMPRMPRAVAALGEPK